jgi:hypothetical protein
MSTQRETRPAIDNMTNWKNIGLAMALSLGACTAPPAPPQPVTFDRPVLDGRDDRAELVDWYLREYNGKCVTLLDSDSSSMSAVEKCRGALERHYHSVEAERGLPYRSLDADVEPRYRSLPPPPMMMETDCEPNVLGGGFSCSNY